MKAKIFLAGKADAPAAADRFSVVFLRAAMALSLLFACGNLYAGCMGDSRLFLFLSVRMLEDGGLYERWFEVNPPLIMLLDAVPAWFIIHAHVPAHWAHALFAMLLSIGSAYGCRTVIRSSPLDPSRRNLLFAASLGVLFILPDLVFDFGDREHTLMTLSLPWIWQMLLGVKPSWTLAALAAVGFCLKPYNLVIALLLTLFGGPPQWRWHRRLFAPSSFAIGCVALGYAAIVLAFFPGYLAELPITAPAYSHTRVSLPVRLTFLPFFLFVIGILIRTGLPERIYRRRAWYAFLAAMAISYSFGGGWNYTQYMLLVPLLLVSCAALMPPDAHRKEVTVTAALMIALLLGGSGYVLGRDIVSLTRNHMPAFGKPPTAEVNRELKKAAGDTFVLLSLSYWSTSVDEVYGPPQSVFGYDNLWLLPYMLDRPDDPKTRIMREKLGARLAFALRTQPPPTLIVDVSPRDSVLPPGFDKLAYLREDPRVDAALRRYAPQRIIDRCTPRQQDMCRFRIWKAENTE
jgi:hypothetical protein